MTNLQADWTAGNWTDVGVIFVTKFDPTPNLMEESDLLRRGEPSVLLLQPAYGEGPVRPSINRGLTI
jgi:hypothetical protein